MKKLKNTLKVVLLALSLLTISCSKDNDSSSQTPQSGNYINAKINGVQSNSLTVTPLKIGAGVDRVILLNGPIGTAGNTLSVTLMGNITTGTFTLNNTSNITFGHSDATTQMAYTTDCSSASGSVTITSITANKVVGTFNFIGKDDNNCTSSVTVTEGSFSSTF